MLILTILLKKIIVQAATKGKILVASTRQFHFSETRFAACFFISMWIEPTAVCQALHPSVTAMNAGIGKYSKKFVDVHTASSNQAALPNLKSLTAAIYTEQRFLLSELNLYAVSICIPVQFGAIGLSAKHFGYDNYNETQIGLAYGKSIGKINMGIQFNRYSLQIPGYGKEAAFNIEAAAIIKLSERIFAGVHLFNPTSGGFGRSRSEKLPFVYTTGLGFEASEQVYIGAEIIKEETQPIGINAGLQYQFAKKLFGRLGIHTQTMNVYFAVGWKWQSFRVDVTSSYHPQLGVTPGLLVLFDANNSDE